MSAACARDHVVAGFQEQHREAYSESTGDRRTQQGDGSEFVDGQVRPDLSRRRRSTQASTAPVSRHVRDDPDQRTVVRHVPEHSRHQEIRTSDPLQRYAGI